MKALNILLTMSVIFGMFVIVYTYIPDNLPYLSGDLVVVGVFVGVILLIVYLLRWGDLV